MDKNMFDFSNQFPILRTKPRAAKDSAAKIVAFFIGMSFAYNKDNCRNKGGIVLQTQKITIIGAGNGGFAAAADLTLRGFEVTLAELPQYADNLRGVLEKGGIELEIMASTGLRSGFAQIKRATADLELALQDAELVLVIVPSFAQRTIAELCAPYIRSGQIIILTPGNFGGAYDFYRRLIKSGAPGDVIVGETNSLMYACRKTSETGVWIRGYKKELLFAAYPGKYTDYVLEKTRSVYPTFTKMNSIWETGLSNPNCLLHIPIMLGNVANIDNQKDVLFYHEALTESIGRIMDAMDEERMTLNQFGFNLPSLFSIVKSHYPHQGAVGDTTWELSHSNPIYPTSKLPTTLDHRYLTEDIPFGLIPLQQILLKYNIPCPTITSVVKLIETMTGKQYAPVARTLDSLGIGELSTEALLHLANEG